MSHSLFPLFLFIDFPRLVMNFFLKSASLNISCLTLARVSLAMVGVLSTLGVQLVSIAMLLRLEPCLPITSPGFSASM